MTEKLEFEYIVADWYNPDGDIHPIIPVILRHRNKFIQTMALVDSGADMNVLPFHIGIELGLSWEGTANDFELHGLAETLAAKAIAVNLEIGSWPTLRMAFAWSMQDETPVILGQLNFFGEVDVCFSRTQGLMTFELPQ